MHRELLRAPGCQPRLTVVSFSAPRDRDPCSKTPVRNCRPSCADRLRPRRLAPAQTLPPTENARPHRTPQDIVPPPRAAAHPGNQQPRAPPGHKTSQRTGPAVSAASPPAPVPTVVLALNLRAEDLASPRPAPPCPDEPPFRSAPPSARRPFTRPPPRRNRPRPSAPPASQSQSVPPLPSSSATSAGVLQVTSASTNASSGGPKLQSGGNPPCRLISRARPGYTAA